MPKTRAIAVRFPLRGANRSAAYQETAPYFTAKSVNVCGVGPLEDRVRGGTRKGLSKVVSNDFGSRISEVAVVTYLDGDGAHQTAVIVIADGRFYIVNGSTVSELTAELVLGTEEFQIGGVTLGFPHNMATVVVEEVSITDIITIGGEELTFTTSTGGPESSVERLGKLFLAGTTLQVFDPATGVLSNVAGAPSGEPLVTVYRDRLLLAGTNHLVYACRVSDPEDWDFGGDIDDATRPTVFQLSEAGRIGETLTAMIPWRDQAVLFATENSLWVLNGDPVSGKVEHISDEIGVISRKAWCLTDTGMVAFLSNDGLYLWGVGSGYPVRFSEERLPGALREINTATNTISMAYDAKERGIWLCVTPSAGAGTHWFFDMANKALWEQRFSANGHQPLAIARSGSSGLKDVLLGCRDGVLRKFDPDATTDDGMAIQSHIVIGAISMASLAKDGLLTEIQSALADNSGSVTWRVFTGPTAESAVDAAVAGVESLVAGTDPVGVRASGTWTELFNPVARPRARGAWCAVVLSAASRWAFEGMTLVMNVLGRQRQ